MKSELGRSHVQKNRCWQETWLRATGATCSSMLCCLLAAVSVQAGGMGNDTVNRYNLVTAELIIKMMDVP